MKIHFSNLTIKNALPALVMGIVNANEDSFFSKSRGGAERAKKLIDEGADIIDIGAESSRPGSEYISEEEEIRRLIPVIKEIRRFSDIAISVDTRKCAVMKAAFENGADILNDISALLDDEKLAAFAAKEKIGVILMHKRGNPATMQNDTFYKNVFEEVDSFLCERAEFAIESGIEEKNIIVDAGIGFGKNLQGNLELLKNCGKLCGGKFPVLMALSRKSFLGEIIGNPRGKDAENRLSATLAADLLAVQAGAKIVRVHDVAETVDSLKVLNSLL